MHSLTGHYNNVFKDTLQTELANRIEDNGLYVHYREMESEYYEYVRIDIDFPDSLGHIKVILGTDFFGDEKKSIYKYGTFLIDTAETLLDLYDISLPDDCTYPFKQYRKILFLADWYCKKPNEENLASLQATVQKMKVDYAAGIKLDKISGDTLTSYLDTLCKKNNITYQIEKDNGFCTVTLVLRRGYALAVELAYAELASQLAGLEGILHKSLELSASPLLPVISLNRSYANLWQ